MGEGFVVEEQIRSVQTDIVQILLLQKNIPVFRGKRLQNILSEAVVCVCGGHSDPPS